MQYVIGIDTGATKSSILVAQTTGKIVEKKEGRDLNYHTIGKNLAALRLKEILSPLVKKYKRVKVVVIGFAGLDTPKDLLVYKKITSRVLPKRIKYFIFNDAKTALESACPGGEARVLIISGTGSSVYGEFQGRTAKAIGWDFLLSDEGSAYWLGMEALRAAVRSWDGRENSILEKMILQKTNKKDMPQFITDLYEFWHRNPEGFKKYIASFSLAVSGAFARKDSLAEKIIEKAAQELALGAKAVIKKLKVKNKQICVGFVGSTFKAPKLQSLLCSKIKRFAPRSRFVYNVNAAKGAVNIALKLLNDN